MLGRLSKTLICGLPTSTASLAASLREQAGCRVPLLGFQFSTSAQGAAFSCPGQLPQAGALATGLDDLRFALTTPVNGSDRDAKADFSTIDPGAVLEKACPLPIIEWPYQAKGNLNARLQTLSGIAGWGFFVPVPRRSGTIQYGEW